MGTVQRARNLGSPTGWGKETTWLTLVTGRRLAAAHSWNHHTPEISRTTRVDKWNCAKSFIKPYHIL